MRRHQRRLPRRRRHRQRPERPLATTGCLRPALRFDQVVVHGLAGSVGSSSVTVSTRPRLRTVSSTSGTRARLHQAAAISPPLSGVVQPGVERHTIAGDGRDDGGALVEEVVAIAGVEAWRIPDQRGSAAAPCAARPPGKSRYGKPEVTTGPGSDSITGDVMPDAPIVQGLSSKDGSQRSVSTASRSVSPSRRTSATVPARLTRDSPALEAQRENLEGRRRGRPFESDLNLLQQRGVQIEQPAGGP